jgi:phosphomannomutase
MDAVFKAYDIRGVYPEQLNEDLAWCIGYGTAQFLRGQLSGYDRTVAQTNSITVGRDMRKSSPALSEAFIEGVLAGGANCIDVGMIDTAQMYFAVNYLKTCGGVQTTASHNPAQYNGFKISGQAGKPIGQDTGLGEIKRIALAVPPRSVTVQGNRTKQDITLAYKSFVRKFLRGPSRKLKIVVDASNGMAGKYWPIVFGDIDQLTTIPLNFEHNGEFVHDPNPLVPGNLKQCQEAVRQNGANFGICFDGDADRCVIIDEYAQIVPNDLLTALLAKAFLTWSPGSAVVYDLRSSWVLREEIEKAGGKPKRERVGHSFIKRAMAESDAVFGGELSGHYYFKDNWYCDSAFLAVVALLNVLDQQAKPVSKLINPLRRYPASGERNFKCEDKDGRIKQLAEKYSDGKIDYLDGITIEYPDWWCNIRKSNTEPLLRLNLEAKTKSVLESKFAEIAPMLGELVAH